MQENTNRDLLTEIAVAYYQHGATQEEIARQFNLSRPKVGRLLKQAREEGIVEITVNYHPVFSSRIEAQLKERFGLKRALISLSQDDPDEQREVVAGLVANHLSRTLNDGMVVAVGQGRNISAVAYHPGVVVKHKCTFVCSIGGIHPRGGRFNADHLSRQFAKKFGGTSETLYAPAHAETPEQKALFMQNMTVKDTLDRARKADVALIGVGDFTENSHMVDLGWFTEQEVIEARTKDGVVGDIAAFNFVDINGKMINSVISDRIIGLGVEEYRHINEVIVVAAEESKPLALLGALRSGCIDILATSVTNAMAILNLDGMKNSEN